MYPRDYNPNRFVSPAGTQFEPQYQGQVNEYGDIELIEVGVKDLRAMHNRDAESCDINNIVARFQNGDITALQAVQGSYMDVVGLPKDLRGMSDMIDSLRASYNVLDDSIKERFPNFQTWLENVGSPAWIEAMKATEESEAGVPAGRPSPVGDQA